MAKICIYCKYNKIALKLFQKEVNWQVDQ